MDRITNPLEGGRNHYSDLTDQGRNLHRQYIQRQTPMTPLEPWMITNESSNAQLLNHYNENQNTLFLSTPPASSHSRQPFQQQCVAIQNDLSHHDEFPTNNDSRVVTNNRKAYSSSPSPSRDRQNSIVSDISNPSSASYGESDKEQLLQPSRNCYAGDGAAKMIANKRDRALERNRQAALRCRQRKKEWLNQLQSTVESLAKENQALEQQSLKLREEIINLKTVLLAHRDCSYAVNTFSFCKPSQ